MLIYVRNGFASRCDERCTSNARFVMTCEWKKTVMAELTKAIKYCAKTFVELC